MSGERERASGRASGLLLGSRFKHVLNHGAIGTRSDDGEIGFAGIILCVVVKDLCHVNTDSERSNETQATRSKMSAFYSFFHM